MQRIPIDDRSLSIFNADGMERTEAGWSLARVPAPWRARFPEATASRAMQAGGVEVRFRTDAGKIGVEGTFQTQAGDPMVVDLYYGWNWVGTQVTAELGRSVALPLWQGASPGTDAPWRVLFHPRSTVELQHVVVEDRARVEPAPRWGNGPSVLLHGDSITHGTRASRPGLTYVAQLGYLLETEVYNLGFGGSAWGDAPVAEYIAGLDAWEVLVLVLGTNTYGRAHESGVAYGRTYARFLDTVRERHPYKPILCVTPIYRRQDGPPAEPNAAGSTPEEYRQAITSAVQARIAQGDGHLHLLDGQALIGDRKGLSLDLVHPDDHGMAKMARGIAEALVRQVGDRWSVGT